MLTLDTLSLAQRSDGVRHRIRVYAKHGGKLHIGERHHCWGLREVKLASNCQEKRRKTLENRVDGTIYISLC